jgi:hypothetical protein
VHSLFLRYFQGECVNYRYFFNNWYDESDVEYFRSTLETAPNDEIGKEKLIEYGYHIDKHIKDLKQ